MTRNLSVFCEACTDVTATVTVLQDSLLRYEVNLTLIVLFIEYDPTDPASSVTSPVWVMVYRFC